MRKNKASYKEEQRDLPGFSIQELWKQLAEHYGYEIHLKKHRESDNIRVYTPNIRNISEYYDLRPK